MNIEDAGISVLVAIASSGGVHWFFKEKIKASLKKEVSRDIASFNHDLSLKGEILKNELQREAFKAELMWNNVHNIYPELTTNIEIANGAIASLQGLTLSPDYAEYNLEDFRLLLGKKNLTNGKQEEFNKLLATDRSSGIKQMTKYLQMIEGQEARNKLIIANNYRISKSIYCSDEVLKAFSDIYDCLNSSLTDLTIGRDYEDMSLFNQGRAAITKEAPAKLEAFRSAVRCEIRNIK